MDYTTGLLYCRDPVVEKNGSRIDLGWDILASRTQNFRRTRKNLI